MPGFQTDSGVAQQEAGFGWDGLYCSQTYQDNITAKAGGGQTSATILPAMVNRVATVATAADSVKLPAALSSKLGLELCVINDASNPVQVFGQSGDTINGVATATGVSQMGKSVTFYSCVAPNKWHAQGLGSGYSGSNQTYSYADALTALAAGGQSGATPITTSIARFTTVATAGDSSILPTAAAGLNLTVINAGATIMNTFPAVGDQINSLGANIAFAVPPGCVVEVFCTAAGTWHTLMSSTTGQAQQVKNNVSSTASFTLTGAQITGGSEKVYVDLTGTLGGAGNAQLPTVAALVTAMTVAGLNPLAGMSYELEIIERSAANVWTITTNTGWTLTGTMTLAVAAGTNARKFVLSLTSLTAAVLTSVGAYNIGPA